MAFKYHPDRNKGERYFTERFQLIQEAYSILSDTERKRIYDEMFQSVYDSYSKIIENPISLNIINLPSYVRGIAKEEIIAVELKIITLLKENRIIDRMAFIYYAINQFKTYCTLSSHFDSFAQEIKFFRNAPIKPLLDLLKMSEVSITNNSQDDFIDFYTIEQLKLNNNKDLQHDLLYARSLFIDDKNEFNVKLIIYEYYKLINYYSCYYRFKQN